jgi:hypothetical protein
VNGIRLQNRSRTAAVSRPTPRRRPSKSAGGDSRDGEACGCDVPRAMSGRCRTPIRLHRSGRRSVLPLRKGLTGALTVCVSNPRAGRYRTDRSHMRPKWCAEFLAGTTAQVAASGQPIERVERGSVSSDGHLLRPRRRPNSIRTSGSNTFPPALFETQQHRAGHALRVRSESDQE